MIPLLALALSLVPPDGLPSSGPGPAAACERPPAADSALAHHYAPELRFAPGERDFPTLPFHTAFDGRGRDFADPSEIAPWDPREGEPRLASWDSLYARYHEAGSGTLRAVLYRVRDLEQDEIQAMWQFLFKDVQASRRFDLDGRWPRALRETTPFRAVEYYFYYLNDTGLEGHKEDIEFVFVFLPADPELACGFRIVVGAGHDPRTPNNVLVRFDDDAGVRDTPVLVELGGHASAPQLVRAPLFAVGRDVNWHAQDVWGTRDILAVSGLGFSGPYQPGMTFARDDDDSWRASLVRRAAPDQYNLVPVQPFIDLSEAVDDARTDTAAALAALKRLEGSLPFTAPTSLDSLQLARLRSWNRDLRAGSDRLSVSKHQVWKHRHYRLTPVMILKEHLFRPSAKAASGEVHHLITYGFGGVPNEAWEFHLGVVVPTFYLPLALPGFLEVQVGTMVKDLADDFGDGGWPGAFMTSVLYDNSYRDRFGWYVRAAFTKERADAIDEPGRHDWSLGAGTSVLLWSFDRRRVDPLPLGVNALRLRVGPRADLNKWNEVFEHFGVEVQVSLRQ